MKRTARHVRRAALCLLACLPPASAAAEWRRLDSPNFIVIGDAGERDLRNIAVRFEGFRETLGRVLGAKVTATAVPTVVVVFPHDRAFTPYKPVYNGKPVRVAGVFYAGRDVNYITLVNDSHPEAYRVVFHEYAHLMISNVVMNLPAWLNEGLAEYYSTYDPARDGREAIIGRPIEHHLQRLAERRLLPLDQLITVDRKSPLYNEGERRSVFYSQSWALTHLLLLGDPPRVNELGAFIGRVQQGVPDQDAWRQAFGDADIERALEQYIRRMSFKAYKYKFTEELTRFDLAATPLPEPEVSAFLAGLRIRQQRLEEADTLADAALRVDASGGHANVAKAQVAIARADLKAAAQRLMSVGAVDDWFVSYAAGSALRAVIERGHDTDPARFAAARAHLTAVGRTREVANALAHLAMLDAMSPGSASAEGRAAIERARALAPGRDDYALVHARLLAGLGEFERARAILGPLMTPGFPEHVRMTARNWMANVVRLEERQRAARASRSTASPPSPVAAPGRPAEALAAETAGTPVLRELRPGEHRLEGTLERIACPDTPPATFGVRTAAGVETLQAATLGDVEFITYRDDLSGSVTCGPLANPLRVYVTWRQGATPGERLAVAIEFLPK